MVPVMEMPVPTVDVVLRCHGEVDEVDQAYARTKVAHIARLAPAPVWFARLDLERTANPAAREHAVTAKARLDVDGRLVRAHVSAGSFREAADRLESKMRLQLERLADKARDEHLRRRDDAWHRADPPQHRPPYFPRPEAEREVVRHKTRALQAMTPEQAVVEAELLDHEFYLFVDVDTGRDAVVARGRAGFEVVRPEGVEAPRGPVPAAPAPAPVLPLVEARDLLDLGGAPFVFSIDPTDGRGRVLYRRYDGHYGLIEPA